MELEVTAMPSLWRALLEPFLDPGSRTFWAGLLASLPVCLLFYLRARPASWSRASVAAILRHPSAVLDVQLLLARQLARFLLGAPAVLGGWWLATHAVRLLDAWLGTPAPPITSAAVVSLLYSAALFLAWDLSRFLAHGMMHRVPVLWAFHQIHHSAEVLTPLTFHRIHPVESAVYQLRGVLATAAVTAPFFWLFRGQASALTLLGVPAVGLLLNLLFGNLRHSHVWLRFPPAVERWFISPAQHQLHHSADPADFDINYGTWLAVWDRLAGTLRISGPTPPALYGIPAAERNHGDDLLSALIGPFRALLPQSRSLALASAVAALLLAAGSAFAQEEEEEEEEEEEYGASMIVVAPDGTPRVAGSAHVVGEAELERFEYDDIGRILTLGVPGVTVRDEDGYGLRPNLGIRGANSDRSAKLTLMEDGVLLAPAPYAAPAAYYFPMSTRMVGVEVFKGPAAIRHGPHTVGGAINLLTRPVPQGLDYRVDLAGGLYGAAKGHAWLGRGDATSGFVVEGVHLRSGGFKELDGGGPTGFDRSEVMLKARHALSASHRLGLKLGYGNETSNETYLGLSLGDYEANPYRRYAASQNDLMRWNRTQAELSWTFAPVPGVDVRTVAYHHWFSRAWTKLNGFQGGIDLHDLLQQPDPTGQAAVYLAILQGEEDSTIDDQILRIGTNDRRFHSGGLQTEARWRHHGEGFSSTLEGGVRLHLDRVRRLHTEDPFWMQGGDLVATGGDIETTLDSWSLADALAAHLHEDLRLDQTHILPGVRLETIRTRQDLTVEGSTTAGEPLTRAILLPGMGILQGVGPWLDAFVGAYRGFSPVAPGQPAEVEPEVSWNYEAGLRLRQGDAHAEVVGFFNDYTNLTGQCTLSGGCEESQIDQQFNGGEAFIWGAEAVAGYTLLLPAELSLPFEATYSLTRSAFRTGFASDFPQFGTVEIGDSLPYVPVHQGSARLTLEHPRFSVALGGTARSGMLDEAGVFPATEADIPPLFLLDAAGHVRLHERVELYVTGSNLTSSTALVSWRPFGARPTAPLQVMAGLKIQPR